MTNDAGETYFHKGEYRELDPPRRIVFTWTSAAVDESIVTVEFQETKKGTRLTLTHDLIPSDELRQKHEGGWVSCLNSLDKVVESLV